MGASVNTAQDGDTGDEYWVVSEDLDGDGTPEEIFYVYDDETGETYVWFQLTVAGSCDDGTDGTGDFFAVVQDDGSGTWLVESDCAEEEGLLFGCDFDTNGNDTACGYCEIAGNALVCTPQ
jgi:hypothetical protein